MIAFCCVLPASNKARDDDDDDDDDDYEELITSSHMTTRASITLHIYDHGFPTDR